MYKKQIFPLILAFITAAVLPSCDDAGKADSSFQYGTIDKEYVIISDVASLQNSEDEISMYIDSIFNGLIDVDLVSTGLKSFDLTDDGQADLRFEIINLNKFNVGQLPAYLDSMAARVHPVNLQILDNSTYGYPDALLPNNEITKNGHWSGNVSVLGTFMNAGQFQGKGNCFLGFRIPAGNDFQYGWIRLNCSAGNDTLRIIDYAYNTIAGNPIYAGQKE